MSYEWGGVILVATTPIRIEIFHYSIKVISLNLSQVLKLKVIGVNLP